MSSWLLFAVLGVGAGALYAAIAIGMVLCYRGSGVVNFAQVTMAAYPAFAYVELRQHGDLVLPVVPWKHRISLADSLPFWPAFLLALMVAALMGYLIERLVFRPLSLATPVTKVIASVGVSTAIVGLISLQFGDSQGTVRVRRTGPILPAGAVRIVCRSCVPLVNQKVNPRSRHFFALSGSCFVVQKIALTRIK